MLILQLLLVFIFKFVFILILSRASFGNRSFAFERATLKWINCLSELSVCLSVSQSILKYLEYSSFWKSWTWNFFLHFSGLLKYLEYSSFWKSWTWNFFLHFSGLLKYLEYSSFWKSWTWNFLLFFRTPLDLSRCQIPFFLISRCQIPFFNFLLHFRLSTKLPHYLNDIKFLLGLIQIPQTFLYLAKVTILSSPYNCRTKTFQIALIFKGNLGGKNGWKAVKVSKYTWWFS